MMVVDLGAAAARSIWRLVLKEVGNRHRQDVGDVLWSAGTDAISPPLGKVTPSLSPSFPTDAEDHCAVNNRIGDFSCLNRKGLSNMPDAADHVAGHVARFAVL